MEDGNGVESLVGFIVGEEILLLDSVIVAAVGGAPANLPVGCCVATSSSDLSGENVIEGNIVELSQVDGV